MWWWRNIRSVMCSVGELSGWESLHRRRVCQISIFGELSPEKLPGQGTVHIPETRPELNMSRY